MKTMNSIGIFVLIGICIMFFAISVLKSVIKYNCVTDKELTQIMEMAYFEGQKDFIQGNIKIKLDNNNKYVWIKPPFDSIGPVWNPQNGNVLH